MSTYKSIFGAGVLLILVILGLTMCSNPPEVTIKTVPNTTEVSADEQISIAAETDEGNLQFEWQVEKGSLSSTDGPSVIYTAPNEAGSDKVSVVVTRNGQTTEKSVTFTVQVDPTPPPTNTPVSKTCQPDSFSQTLRILQWKHFVPEYDQWFDEFAKEWGCQNQVNVIVDHIDLFNIAYCLEAEIAEYKGQIPNFDIASCFNQEREGEEKHDLIEMIVPPHEFVLDLVDFTQFIEKELSLGEQARTCRESSSFIDEKTNERKYFGLCHGWVPELSLYNQALWKTHYPNGLSTYLELLDGGTTIKEDHPEIKVGIGLRPVDNENSENKDKDPALDVNNAIRAIFWSFGAFVQNFEQNVAIDSDETIEATKYIVNLYNQAIESKVEEWNDKSNNVCLAQNQDCSYIINAISAYRDAQKAGTDGDIFLAPPLKGPADVEGSSVTLAPPHLTQVYVIPDFVNSNQQAMTQGFVQAFMIKYEQVMEQSQLYTLSAWPDQYPIPEGLLDDKTKILKKAIAQEQNTNWLGWTRNIGYPGATNAAVVKVFRDNILPNMVADVAEKFQENPEMTDQEYEKVIRDEIDKAKKDICAIFLDPKTRPKQDKIEGCE